MLSVQHLQEVRTLITVLQGEAPITLAEAMPEQADYEQVHAVVRWLYEQAAIDVFTSACAGIAAKAAMPRASDVALGYGIGDGLNSIAGANLFWILRR
ncbi:hypothetical protein [Pseudomonas sp. CFBP 13719]|uniref:hypothetical protein n=1 Tax=Pseudomonas sp. CFBP 13719 TaxID=2775303 RepID=UPI00177A917A|nr:hypothetical protein [Pseudomonas sp. CFBP 13719]MBD8683539.1 hypothetical protein [Pseudomonas sp. CFBP 13719]